VTANTDLFDASLRHQVALRRYSATVLKRMRRLLQAADRDLAAQLRERLPDTEGKRRLQELIKEVRALRKAMVEKVQEELREELLELGQSEVEWEQKIIRDVTPIELSLASVPLDRIQSLVDNEPFQGQKLKDWFKDITARDRSRLDRAITLGVVNGETTDDIVRRVVGTRVNKYTDGVLSTTRREADTLVRTAVNHASNASRELLWGANSDIIWALRWTATLDGRTSKICITRDGDYSVVPGQEAPSNVPLLSPQTARPPAHPNCRSTMVAALSPDGILGERPFVRDKRDRRKREIDFRREAKEKAGDRWKTMSSADRRTAISSQRKAWGEKNIGRVPAETTYEEWLKRQDGDFQNAVLGPTRAKLWRSGKVELDDFVDAGGRTRSLSEMDQLIARNKERTKS